MSREVAERRELIKDKADEFFCIRAHDTMGWSRWNVTTTLPSREYPDRRKVSFGTAADRMVTHADGICEGLLI